MANPEYVLEMRDIVKVFPGVRALDGVKLQVRPGKVHVICGENGAGKSTLMKIINGTYVADEGEMFYKGEKIGPHTVQDTLKMGIAMIYQELNPVLEMTIAENIWLGREPRKGRFVDFGKMQKDTQELLDKLDMPYKATQKMYELSIAGHQLVEIAKAISCSASVIIMDEPSSAIGDEEINVLFKQIFSLREQGVAILYITHKMDEIFRIADDITIIRDGQWIETGPATDYNPDKLVARMVGREITNVFPKDTTVPIGDVIFEVKDLTQAKEDGGRFRGINFQLRAGEILGFAGLVGAGRSEVMRAIFGLDPITSGSVYLKKYTKGLIDDRKISKDVEKMRELLQIKIANEDIEAATLSGGNQQKVVLAKWLVGDVKVMILDEPTRGIDVGAKSEIHKLMTNFARQGMGIIMISSELPEVLGMSDRVVVMQEGIVQGILDRSEATQESIMKLATRGVGKHE